MKNKRSKKKAIIPKGGNNRVMTPLILVEKIVKHYQPEGRILEPCKGTGNFLKFMNADWYEIDEGKDFMEATGHWDWIITNPPYSEYRAFLNKSMEVADNIVFLQLINAIFYKARLKDMYEHNFGIKEILLLDTPKEFPQFGLQLGCVYFKKNIRGVLTHTRWKK